MRAHVPAVGQERHGVRKKAGGDFDDHHHARNGYDDARAALSLREIAYEIVGMAETGVIRVVHLALK